MTESAKAELALGQGGGLDELIKTANRNCLTLHSAPINSSQRSQCHVAGRTPFYQVAVHHPDHLYCLSPCIFTNEVMLSSSQYIAASHCDS